MVKIIMVQPQRCLGCQTCVLECAMAHTEAHTMVEALSAETPPQPRVHVEPLGEFGVPMQCRHCEDAPCIMVCPKEALHRLTPEGPVLLDADRCSGCKLCTLVCPFGVISVSRDGKAVIKCDLCFERTEAGQEPACVAACPTGALRFVELDDHLRERRREAERVVCEKSPRLEEPKTEEKMASCRICGRAFAPRKQLEFVRSKIPDHIPVPHVCPQCRRTRAAALLAEGTDLRETPT